MQARYDVLALAEQSGCVQYGAALCRRRLHQREQRGVQRRDAPLGIGHVGQTGQRAERRSRHVRGRFPSMSDECIQR